MAVDYIYYNWAEPWAENGSGQWTLDIDWGFPLTVFATTSMGSFDFNIWATDPSPSGVQGFFAASGIISYTTTSGTNNVGMSAPGGNPVDLGASDGFVPAIFDEDVLSVSFYYGVGAQMLDTGDSNGITASFTFQVFGDV